MPPEVIDVKSPDGTRLGVERVGHGPPLLAVHGGTADRTRWAPVKEQLAERFTLYLLDRRGRGSSLEEAPDYSLRRESEDAAAVLDLIGEPVFYLGHSYGALIGMDLLPLTNGVSKALLYEPPFDTPGHVIAPEALLDALLAFLEKGDREGALELFYSKVVGVDPTPIRDQPIWQVRLAAVHTLEREGRIGLRFTCDPALFADVDLPVRVLLGENSPASFRSAAQTAAAAIPGAELVELLGQGHAMIDADPDGFVAQVVDFFEQPPRVGDLVEGHD